MMNGVRLSGALRVRRHRAGHLGARPRAIFAAVLVSMAAVLAMRPGGSTARARSAPGAMDWSVYGQILSEVVDAQGHVRYARLASDRSALDEVVRGVAAVDPRDLAAVPREEQVAFWINAYNVLTLRLIVDHYPLTKLARIEKGAPGNSIRQIDGAWTVVQFTVAGERMTLDHVENKILRARFGEPGIHMALVCAALSCPPLRAEPYTAARLAAQLDDQARRFLGDPGHFSVDRKAAVVRMSPIFDWFAGDFSGAGDAPGAGEARGESVGGSDELPEDHVATKSNAPPARPAGNARVDKRLRGAVAYVAAHVDKPLSAWLRTAAYRVDFLPYDWTLNDASTPPEPGGAQ